MNNRKVGIWLIGAWGSVSGTVALGLSALEKGLTGTSGLVTALPELAKLDLDSPGAFTLGGHDIRRGSFLNSIRELHDRSSLFSEAMIDHCTGDLATWSANVRPGTILHSGQMISSLADQSHVQLVASPRQAIEQIQADLKAFQDRNRLDQIVVINAASTEPLFESNEEHGDLSRLEAVLDRTSPPVLPTSSMYAYASIDLGHPYINLTPSCGATLPALQELAAKRGVPIAGQDLKTGETLIKSVLAPLFAKRNLHLLSWVGHNILGNRDGMVLHDPANKASKVKSKDSVLTSILGYKPQTHVSIEYIESLDDWKTAWDHIHFEGFLGVKMTLQFTWQGSDSILAAPLVIDVARLALLAQRRGESGVMHHTASFFKSPMNVDEHDFSKQFQLLEEYTQRNV
jgi:myo-inositol-1-phosphate synthase